MSMTAVAALEELPFPTAPGKPLAAERPGAATAAADRVEGSATRDEAEPAEVDVLGLDPARTVEFVTAARRRADAEAAAELRGVAHWADLHRTDGFVGAVDPGILQLVTLSEAPEAQRVVRAAKPTGELPVLGLEGELRLAGEGAFSVEEFAVAELGAALGMSEAAARRYVGQALELRDRLPRLWAAVMAGKVPAWKARQVAAETIFVSAPAADYVDRQLAPFAHRLSLHRALRVVAAAVARFDPDLAKARAERAADRRDVWVDDDPDGTSTVTAVTATPDAAAFLDAVESCATVLGRLGDEDPRRVRRAKALGVLADPQYALDLAHAAEQPAAEEAAPVRHRQGADLARRRAPSLQVHLHTDALSTLLSAAPAGDGSATGHTQADAGGHVVRVDGRGPRSLAAFRDWLTGLTPGAVVKLTPVVDLNQHVSVNAYEIPDRLRAQVGERDLTCQFPWCGREGRFDVDHIEPYVFDDLGRPGAGPPPGQTTSVNLARLCRFHHRLKTHSTWHYERQRHGGLLWTSPLGRVYSVDENGTLPRG